MKIVPWAVDDFTGLCLRFILTAVILFLLAVAAMAQPRPSPITTVLQAIVEDANAALADAKDHNDQIAVNCWSAIASVAQAKLQTEQMPGGKLMYAFQKVRDITRLSSSPQGTTLIMGCAPLVQDAKLNMVSFFTNIGGAVLIKGLLVP